MENPELFQLQYPIGKFTEPSSIEKESIDVSIADIASFPEKLTGLVGQLSEAQLDTPYRPGGWTVRQVVHHCADSHMNSLIRFKLALTEDKPVIKPYHEDRWAELADSRIMEVETPLTLIRALHSKWVFLLRSLDETDLDKVYVHPEAGKEYRLSSAILLYAWHCNHHLAHITSLASRMGWK
ncbi:bacillithiol transferase BstA [Flavihumibacter sp. R14]|nr:bacillithiol transferase BstA [Flavihumibacter soli]